MAGAYCGLNVFSHASLPLHPLTAHMREGANIINIVVNFIALSFIAHYFTVAVGKAESALKRNRETLQTILAASPVGMAYVVARRIRWVNEVLGKMLGYDPSELVGQGVDLFYPEPSKLAQIEGRIYGTDDHGVDLDSTRLRTRDNGKLDCMIKVRPIDSRDRGKGSVIAVMDISQLIAAEKARQELEARVQRAKKMEAIGLLAGGVAHDLNNVLSGIVSYPELLLLDLPPDSPLAAPIATIKKSGDKASAIVQDLLSLARRGITTKEVVNLNTVIEDYLKSPELDRICVHHPDVRIKTALDGALLNVQAVSVHLAKVVMNLVTNAMEAMPRGGTVHIGTQNRHLDRPLRGYDKVEQGDYVVLWVTDNGIGMSAEDVDRIFEPFYTKKVMGRSGTGLGLAVIWGIVKDCGGYIDVTSDPEAGSTFTLYFPATRDKPAVEAAGLGIATLMGKGESVLVVDDVAEQREIASGMLKRLGYSVFCVASGEAAVDFTRDTPVDLVLLDMIMDPGMDGLATYRRIVDRYPGQRAVIASGYAETEQVREAQRLGAGQYIKKPYTLGQLGAVVRKNLDTRPMPLTDSPLDP